MPISRDEKTACVHRRNRRHHRYKTRFQTRRTHLRRLDADLMAAIPELSGVADIRVVEYSNVNSALKDDLVIGIVVKRRTATL